MPSYLTNVCLFTIISYFYRKVNSLLSFCDEYDNKIEDLTFLKTVKKYCDDRGYDFIWFCKDVEQVYIGKRVDNSKKKNESTKFKKNNLITKVDVHRLSGRDYRIKTSNIMTVLDSYQELKRK